MSRAEPSRAKEGCFLPLCLSPGGVSLGVGVYSPQKGNAFKICQKWGGSLETAPVRGKLKGHVGGRTFWHFPLFRLGRARPGRAEPSWAEPKPNRAEPGRAEPGRAGPSQVGPSSGQTEPSQAELGQAEGVFSHMLDFSYLRAPT